MRKMIGAQKLMAQIDHFQLLGLKFHDSNGLDRYQGLIKTSRETYLYTSIILGDPKKEDLLILGGITYDTDRSISIIRKLNNEGYNLIAVDLLGQGRTLYYNLTMQAGSSLKNDITSNMQVTELLKLLARLKPKNPINILGVSYGGAIAAMAVKKRPTLFNNLLLVVPYIAEIDFYSIFRLNPFFDAYRDSLIKKVLTDKFLLDDILKGEIESKYRIDISNNFQSEYLEALFRLTKGLEKLDLRQIFQDIHTKVHLLVKKDDPEVSNSLHEEAWRRLSINSQGSFTITDEGDHSLIDSAPPTTARWVHEIISTRTKDKSDVVA